MPVLSLFLECHVTGGLLGGSPRMSKKSSDDLTLTPSAQDFFENKKEFGWPGASKLPFVGSDYYQQFDPKYRPKFGAGGPTVINLSMQDLSRIQEIYSHPFTHATFINMSLRPHILTIAGATPGSLVDVTVPPFGVLRGDTNQIGKIGINGSPYSTFYAIAPEGDCGGNDTFKDKTTGDVMETCKRTNCPRHPANGLVHSVQHALHFVGSIGDGLQNPLNPKVVDGEAPDEQEAHKMLRKYQKIDPRPPVILFVSRRVQWLMERAERRIATRTDANARLASMGGQSSSGG